MKRGLVFALTALALVLGNSAAQAQTNAQLSLNLRYNDPANPAEGGRWYLMGKTTSTFGLAGVSAYLKNVDIASISLGNPTANAQYATMAATVTGSIANAGAPYKATVGGEVNVVWGLDLANVPAFINIGKGGVGSIANDPLKNATWNNAALLVSGTWTGAARPEFGTVNPTGVNLLSGNSNGATGVEVLPANLTKTVRGDSLASLGLNTPATAGLRLGDANRDFTVNLADFAALQNNYNQAPGTKGWDQGDFNNDGNVNLADFASLQNNYNQASPAPTVAAVPEPCALTLSAVGLGLAACAARRRSR